jgi:hypothetical protein
LVLERFTLDGELGCWCEGGSVNLLMKAASLDVLARLNTFSDRADAVRRFSEAQFTILQAHKREILGAMRSVGENKLTAAVAEVCSDHFVSSIYPRVTAPFLLQLWYALGPEQLVAIAQKFFEKPYEYRAGWPDLTLIDGPGVHFVEVKTTDRLHEAQLRFAAEVASPLALRCQVVRVEPVRHHSAA